MSNTVSRLKEYIDLKGISVRKFEESVGFSNGSFASQYKNNKTIGVDKVEYILHVYEEINPVWLLTGQGNMLKFEAEQGTQPAEPPKPEPPPTQQVTRELLDSLLTLSKELGRAELQIERLKSDLKRAEGTIKNQAEQIKEDKRIIAGLNFAATQPITQDAATLDTSQAPTLQPPTKLIYHTDALDAGCAAATG